MSEPRLFHQQTLRVNSDDGSKTTGYRSIYAVAQQRYGSMFQSDSKFRGASNEKGLMFDAVGVIGLTETSHSTRFVAYVKFVGQLGPKAVPKCDD